MALRVAGGGGGSPYNPAAVAITGGTIDNTVIGGSTPAAGSFTTVNASGIIESTRAANSSSPAIGFAGGNNGIGALVGGDIAIFGSSNVPTFQIGLTPTFRSDGGVGWASSTSLPASPDTAIARALANGVQFGTSYTLASATSRVELNKTVGSIADNVATAVLTITIPNAAHSASVKVRLTGSLGAGGAIGANEATGAIEYDISIARTSGVNAVATISTAYGSATSSVAGGATITISAAMSSVSGGVGATNTFTVNVTIHAGSGSSTNHTCLVYAQLMNANASGVTIS